MSISFYRNYAVAKAGALNASVLGLIVNWDPKGASEADLMAREQFLDKIGSQLVAVRRQFDAETKTLQPKLDSFNQRVAAAEDLHRQAETLPMGSPERAGKEKSLSTLLGMIEADQPDIDQAKQDVIETKQWLEERENAHKEAASSLRAAKGQLERAQKDLSRATQQASREQSRTADARAASGLAVDNTGLNTALNAMRQATEKAHREADEAKLKRQTMAPTPVVKDQNIEDALARAAGKPVGEQSVTDRLNAIKSKIAA